MRPEGTPRRGGPVGNPSLSARSKPPRGGFFHLGAERGGFEVTESPAFALARGDSPAGCRTRDRKPSDSCGQRGRHAGVAPWESNKGPPVNPPGIGGWAGTSVSRRRGLLDPIHPHDHLQQKVGNHGDPPQVGPDQIPALVGFLCSHGTSRRYEVVCKCCSPQYVNLGRPGPIIYLPGYGEPILGRSQTAGRGASSS